MLLTPPPETRGAGPAPAPASILGLDGLRAFSVVAVLLFHARFQWMRGGYLGVEVFFVISGFLITTLLLREVAAKGGIALGAFWRRRMRRLLPALCAVLLALAGVGAGFLGARASQFRADLLASFLYLENWHQIRSQASYFADQGLPLLRHLWSLSVEGQFYFAWPVLVWAAARLGKRRIGPLVLLTLALAAASLALALGLADPGNASSVRAMASLNRVYLGTDTRAFGLLAGALLALALHAPERPRALGPALGRTLDLAAFAGLAGIALLMVRLEVQAPFLYRGGLLLVDALTALVIAALVVPERGWMARCLGWAPLEWIGRRSYGIYLWHWPVYRLLLPEREGLPWLGLRLLVTLLLTEATLQFLENPIRKGGLKRLFARPGGTAAPWRWRLGRASILATAATAVAAPAILLASRPAYVDPIQESIQAGAAALVDLRQAPAPAPAAAPPAARGAAWEPGPPIVPAQALKGLQVTAIGDSVMKGAAPALKRMGEVCLGAGKVQIDAEECRPFGNATEILRTCKKENRLGEIVVIHLGTNNSSLPEEQFRRLMGVLADTRLVLFLTVKSDKLQACEAVNRELGVLVAGFPNARLVDWSTLSDPHPEFFYSDHTHLRPEGTQFYAETILGQLALPPGGRTVQARGILPVDPNLSRIQ